MSKIVKSRRTTSNARVGGLQVGSEVFRARLHAVERRIWNDESTGTTTRASSVQNATDVGGATEMTVAASDAASELHAPVTSCVDQHHLTMTTRCVERLHVAVFRRNCNMCGYIFKQAPFKASPLLPRFPKQGYGELYCFFHNCTHGKGIKMKLFSKIIRKNSMRQVLVENNGVVTYWNLKVL